MYKEKIKNIDDFVKVGDKIKVKVILLDTADKKLKLSIKFSGTNNPMYGSTYVWYTNGKNNKRCTSENIETLISLGYYKGKTEKRKN